MRTPPPVVAVTAPTRARREVVIRHSRATKTPVQPGDPRQRTAGPAAALAGPVDPSSWPFGAGRGDAHVDLTSDDLAGAAERAVALGASRPERLLPLLRTPRERRSKGARQGGAQRSGPVLLGSGAYSRTIVVFPFRGGNVVRLVVKPGPGMAGQADPATLVPDPRLCQPQSERLSAVLAFHLVKNNCGENSRAVEHDDIRLEELLAVPPQPRSGVPGDVGVSIKHVPAERRPTQCGMHERPERVSVGVRERFGPLCGRKQHVLDITHASNLVVALLRAAGLPTVYPGSPRCDQGQRVRGGQIRGEDRIQHAFDATSR